jgi:hypothetical protein
MAEAGDRIYVWLEGEPGLTPPSVSISDEPGVNDLDQLGWAIARGELGRYLPITLQFATHPEPSDKAVRSVDVARLLRERNIRHRRRYEVFFPAGGDGAVPE